MDNKKRESLAIAEESEVHKASEILEMREGVSALQSPEVDGIGGVGEPHTVLTALPTGVEPLGSTNHIHVQLFDGQVIQITSAPLVETGMRVEGASERKGCREEVKRDERSCVEGGEVAASGGAVTLLTSNGKTYILPQPLNSAEVTEGGYLISDEVLSAEEVLQSNNVLHGEQMLTISTPPQPTLDFPTPVANHPDALAIATSEVFSEDYVSLPLETQGTLTGGSRSFKFKTVDEECTQGTRPHVQRNDSPVSEQSIITITAANTTGSDEWLERSTKDYNAPSGVKNKGELEKIGDTHTYATGREETVDFSMSKCKMREIKDDQNMKQVHHDDYSGYSSVYAKWIGSQNIPKDSASKLHLAAASPKVSAVCNIQGESIKSSNKPSAKAESEEINKEGIQCDQEDISTLETQDQAKLRRSSRIRKVKKLLNEEDSQLVEEASSLKRRKGVKGDASSSALWECDSCDAMFRTKVGRDRHVREGHAFTCYMCGWEGRSKTKYEVHISAVHCNQQARCLACRKDFPSYEAYKQHMKVTHPATTITTTTAAATTTASSVVSTPSIAPYVAVKTEAEYDSQLEEGVRKEEEEEDKQQSNRFAEEKQDPDDPNFKDFHSYGERGCPYCGKTFSRRSRFLRHLNYHLGNRNFICNICTKCFVEKSGLDAHLLTHSPINKPCAQCGKVFKTQRTMKRHLRTHLNKTYTCDFCGKQFRHEESLRVHKSVHKEGGSGNTCTVCEKDCKTPHYLQLHMTTKHEAAKFTCHRCERSFKWKQSYRKHMAIHHEDAYLKFKCNICPRHFMTTSELRLHQVVHSSEKKHLCDSCGKAFKHEYTRDKHMKTVHREDREHMCSQCGALFKAKAYLDQHLAHVHTTKERVKCKYCGHDFKTEANLKSHIKIVHKPRNPKYTCKTCHKVFLAPKDLVRHSKVHSGVRDYVCPKCKRCFSRKDNMAAHFRTHTTNQHSPDSLSGQDLVSGITQPAPQATSQELPHLLSLPSSDAGNLPPVSSSNIILSSVSTSPGSIVLSNVTPTNNLVLSGESPQETAALTSASAPSDPGDPVTGHGVSLASLPVSSMGDLSNIPSSTGSIIFSTVPISSLNITNIPSSSNSVIATSAPMSDNLVFSRVQSTPDCLTHSSLSSSSSSSSLTGSNPSVSSPTIHLSHGSPAPCGIRPDQQTYSLNPHRVVSSQHQAPTIPSILTASSSVQSAILSLPSPHSTSTSSVLMAQNNRTQMVCSTFQGEQVVLDAGTLSPVAKGDINHDGNPPQYTQLDPLSASISSTSSTNMSVNIGSLSSSVSSNATLATSVPISTDASHHNSSVGVPEPVESNIILPTSSLLQETTLLLPEKSELYTIVGEGGKITPLETLALHPGPPPPPSASHSD